MSGTATGVGGSPSGGGAPVDIAAQIQPSPSNADGNKLHRFDETFELYRAVLDLWMNRLQYWDVAFGTETRSDSNIRVLIQQCNFNLTNEIGSRATILRGLHGCQNDDAPTVCSMTTATKMWRRLFPKKPARLVYVVRLRRQLYQHSPQSGASMVEYL